MKFTEAVKILMQSAERDVGGCGRGYRSTTEEWRKRVSEAWVVCFRKIHRRDPDESDLFNAGISFVIEGREGA